MHGLIDYKGIQEPSSGNTFLLLAFAKQIIGERLLFARRGYPDELHLHFGEPIQIRGPKDRIITRGSYILSGAASAWIFKSPCIHGALYSGEPLLPFFVAPLPEHSLILNDEETDRILKKGGESGAAVVALELLSTPFGFGIMIVLSDRSVVTIIPAPDSPEGEQEEIEVPDWELFTPYNRYLRVGPGAKWSYLPSGKQEGASASMSLSEPNAGESGESSSQGK